MQTPQPATIHTSKEDGESPVAKLNAKITERTATIGVVGIGYVGLPLALAYAEAGFRAIGIDVKETYVEKLNAGINFNKDLDDDAVRACVADGRLSGDTTYDQGGDIDVSFICVPTPVNANKEPDTSYIQAAAEAIAETLRAGQLIILKSTTHPNTTEGLVQPILEAAAKGKGLTLGEDYFLAFSPERIDPGNTKYTTANTPIVVGGVTDTCTAIATYALKQIVNDVHVVSNPRVAEMEKLLENIFRSVNIALVNELAQLCDRMGGVSIWEVVEAAATKPFGFMPFYPGPGLGGHCIPVDPHYLAWVARSYDFETSFITLSARINEQMPFYVANSVIQAIAEQPVGLKDARVLLLGVAFKKNVNDTRRSPAYTVARLLRERGVANLAFADPHVESFELKTSADGVDELPRVELSDETLKSYDVAVLLTDHDAFPYQKITEHIPVLVDTRNGFAHMNGDGRRIRVLGAGDGST
jgi:UDP-N-acetyl-D-glucosamine dehydrogenase